MPVEATVLPNGSYYLPGSDKIIPQHHRLMIVSTVVPTIQWQMSLIAGVVQCGVTHPRLDASLLQ
jgi:hypothetical protein